MNLPLGYKQSLWTQYIGEEYKTTCEKCNKEVNAFQFDITYDKNKKPMFTHIKC